MGRERRNLYRQLHVQPEAPPEVIKAAWRALMSSLRVHPDLGGDTDQAARLNAAYEVLSDPERRRAYDLSLRRPARSASHQATGPVTAGATGLAGGHACAFCQRVASSPPQRDSRCAGCGSPLQPAPTRETAAGELLGRRQGERFCRAQTVEVRLPGDRRTRSARLRDLSFSGLSLLQTEPVAQGSVMRVRSDSFDALVSVVGCRSQPGGYAVHARLLTLNLPAAARGVYVDAQA
jgi:curved DNA-binding protein CbpA